MGTIELNHFVFFMMQLQVELHVYHPVTNYSDSDPVVRERFSFFVLLSYWSLQLVYYIMVIGVINEKKGEENLTIVVHVEFFL